MTKVPRLSGKLTANIKEANRYTGINCILLQKLVSLEQLISVLEAKVETISSSSGYYTIKAWARLNRLLMPNPRAKAIGKSCAQLCRERSLEIGKARDEAFGEVNTYPESIIAEVVRAQADLGFLGR
jgi:hypothetical protein